MNKSRYINIFSTWRQKNCEARYNEAWLCCSPTGGSPAEAAPQSGQWRVDGQLYLGIHAPVEQGPTCRYRYMAVLFLNLLHFLLAFPIRSRHMSSFAASIYLISGRPVFFVLAFASPAYVVIFQMSRISRFIRFPFILRRLAMQSLNSVMISHIPNIINQCVYKE